MGNVYPFPQRFGISSDFNDHKRPNPAYPGRETEPGNDYLTPYRTPIYAIWDNTYIDSYVNGYGTKYLVMIRSGSNERLDFIHAIVDKIHYTAKAGDIVGYSDGLSDKPARSSGPHVLVTYRPDWINNRSGYIDCKPFFDSLPLKSNISNQPTMNNDEFITVNDGEGLFSVAQRAGLPANVDGAKQIYNLNQGWRGSDSWESLNARMGGGDRLRIKPQASTPTPAPIPAVNNDKELNELKAQIEANNKTNQIIQEELKKTYEAKINEVLTKLDMKTQEELKVADEKKALQDELKQYKQAMNIDFGIIPDVIADVVNQTLTGNGLLTKWGKFIDSHIKSASLKSILKYDIFVGIGALLSIPTLGVWLLNSGIAAQISGILNHLSQIFGYTLTPEGVVAGIIGIASIGVKLLLTRYDSNKDGILDINDTEILKNYKK